jgi:hypothetical protein
MFDDYWPWWLGALALGVMTVAMWRLEGRILGVSGSWGGAVDVTREEEEAARKLDAADPAAIEDAMLRATLEAFGPEAVAEYQQEMAEPSGPCAAKPPRKYLPRTVHVVFLAMMGVGGALGALLRGSWRLHFDLGPVHEALTGGGATSVVTLVFGGVLVGFGTRMAGGCTSGHGLSGCSRLVPSSLVATASFFGTGVAVSFLLEAVTR